MKDTIVESVIEQFKQRSKLGMKKYGVTLDRDDLSTLQWLQHFQEELFDASLYVEKLKEGLKNDKEIYKNVIGYEEIYKISNLGNVKSFKFGKEKNLKINIDRHGYLYVGLNRDNTSEKKKIHQLVAESFLNHKRCGMKLVVNHIDFDKTNNCLENLEIITQRENSNRKHIISSSKYVGVNWHKRDNKWMASIVINGKKKHLGYFTTELEASKAYEKALLNNYEK